MATGDPLHHLSAEQRRRGALRLIRTLFPERFAEQPADPPTVCGDGDDAAEYSLTSAPESRS